MTPHTIHRLRSLLSLSLLLTLAACGGRDPGPTPAPVDPVERVVDVQIDPAEVTLEVGETVTLAALVTTETVEPGFGAPALAEAEEPEVTWASFSSHVATVAADGTVTAVGPGSSLVTATAGGITAQATVTVREPVVDPPPPGPVARVELSETQVALAGGDARTLTATPVDADGKPLSGHAVRWQTSDEGVVYVTAGGELRAVRAGTAEVTATVNARIATAFVTVTLALDFDLFFEAYSADAGRFGWWSLDLRDSAAGATLALAGGAVEGRPVPSPAGDRIAFTLNSSLNPNHQLRVVDLHRTTLWSLDLPGEVVDAAWSWDGASLAFSLRSAETGLDLWTVRADGSGAVNLTASLGADSNESQPTWAPAATGKLAFTRTLGGASSIWTVDADGANPTRLTNGLADADPAWSPDGSSIAFQRSSIAIFGDLYFVSPTGAIQRSLVGRPGVQGRPAWSPDGAMVAFVDDHDVSTIRKDGTLVARRTFDGEATEETRPGWLKRR